MSKLDVFSYNFVASGSRSTRLLWVTMLRPQSVRSAPGLWVWQGLACWCSGGGGGGKEVSLNELLVMKS